MVGAQASGCARSHGRDVRANDEAEELGRHVVGEDATHRVDALRERHVAKPGFRAAHEIGGRAGGTTWTSYSIDTATSTVFLATGNAAPDFLHDVRAGSDYHAYSVVGLDARSGALRSAVQLLPGDVHDWDMAATPVLLSRSGTGGPGDGVIQAGKDGYVYGIDRASGAVMFRTEVSSHVNVDAPLTSAGTRFCPGAQASEVVGGPDDVSV